MYFSYYIYDSQSAKEREDGIYIMSRKGYSMYIYSNSNLELAGKQRFPERQRERENGIYVMSRKGYSMYIYSNSNLELTGKQRFPERQSVRR